MDQAGRNLAGNVTLSSVDAPEDPPLPPDLAATRDALENVLSLDEARILILRYGSGRSIADLATSEKLSQEGVREVLASAESKFLRAVNQTLGHQP